ncbi:MAG: hypothetical protein ISQ23_03780 [Alphaproteobacteria bacterium]|nr:hypothetical protein [Alphaproteobacteria bacterium]MBL6776614.1 hypothetical protein [Alphaproteobacteria bacterium]
MEDKREISDVKEKLAAAGIKQADIDLAAETSATLLDLLASYPLDERLKKSVKDIFEDAATSQHRTVDN